MICPKCETMEMTKEDEGRFPECAYCGFVQYDERTLALQREVRSEQKTAKDIFGFSPKYADWTEYLNEQDAMRKAQLEEQIRSDH